MVQGLHVRPEPVNLQHLQNAGLAGTTVEALRRDAARAEEAQISAVRGLFEEMRTAAGLHEAEELRSGDGASARFEVADGAVGRVLMARARAADLVVLGRSRGRADPAAGETLNVALTRAARPVLLAPDSPPEHVGRTVIVAWNDSAEAMRALSAAVPLLEMASEVTLVRVVDPATGAGGDLTAAEEFLAWHGIEAKTAKVPRLEGTGASLLKACKDRGGDLLVMGASSHSRLRELAIGGATRHVLREAWLPVFLVH